MTGTGTSIARSSSGDDGERADSERPGEPPRAEPYVLPPWAIQIVRVVLRALFRLLFRLRLRGTEHIPRGGGLIVAANHQSYFDPFWIAAPFGRQLRFLAWDAVFGWPVAGQLIRLLGAWPLQVQKGDARAIRRSVQWLRAGGALVIFPEGGRAYEDGAMLPLKPGAARLALETGVPVLPVTIRGGQRIWPRNRRWPRLGRVEIIYHPLLRVEQRPGEDTRAAARRETERLAAIIAGGLGESD